MAEGNESRRSLVGAIAGPLLFAAALLLYALTGARHAVPDGTSYVFAGHLDLVPVAAMSHPVWGWVVQLLGALPWPSVTFAVTVFTALCAAGAVWLLSGFTAHIRRDVEGGSRAAAAAVLAGFCAGAYFLVCTPAWYTANRPHYAPFDFLLLLGGARLLQSYGDTGDLRRLYAATALFALLLPELATALVLAPAAAAYALFMLLKWRHHRPGVLLALAGIALIAPAAYLVAGWQYFSEPMAAWRDLESYPGLVKVMVLEQISTIRGSVPKLGWITVFMSACVPWIACTFFIRSGRRVEHGAGTLILYAVMIVVAGFILFNGTFSAWSLLGASNVLVLPYILTASYFGLAVAGCVLIIQNAFLRQRRAAPAWIGPAFAAASVALCATAAVRNFGEVDTRPASQLHRVTSAMAAQLEGRDIAFTDGTVDGPLAIEAHDARRKLSIVSLPFMQVTAYRRHAGAVMGGGRYAALAEAGLWPALSTWMRADPRVTERVAVSFSPNSWLLSGRAPLPDRAWYFGEAAAGSADPAALLARNEAFWAEAVPALHAITGAVHAARRLALNLSAIANDLGVYLENAGHATEAGRAYDGALVLNPANISATVNRARLLDVAGRADEAAGAWARAAALREEPDNAVPFMAVLERDGHIRTREAVEGLLQTKDEQASPAGEQDTTLNDAVLKHLQGKTEEARMAVEGYVTRNPGHDAGWLLLAAIAVDMKDEATFQRCLNHMRDQNKEWPEMLLILGQKALERGDIRSAREYYERAALLRPDNPRVHEMLLGLDLREGDVAAAERRARALLNLNPTSLSGNYALGVVLTKRGDYDLAESAFRYVLERRDDPLVLNNLAWILQKRGAYDEALKMAEAAAAAMPDTYAVWDTKGAILMELGRLEEAARDLDRAAGLNPKSIEVQIHRAQLAARQGRGEEARSAARQLLDTAKDLDKTQTGDLKALLK